jgi:uncharacterized membrane protein required for colicin V production
LAASVVVVRLFYAPVAEWLIAETSGDLSPEAAPWAAGALLLIVTIGLTTAAGRFLRRGAKAAGLGWADRAGGLAIGAAEGVLIAAIVIGLVSYVVGAEHKLVMESKSVAVIEDLEHFTKTGELPEGFQLPDVSLPKLPAVASPPPGELEKVVPELEGFAEDADLESLGG